jgi:hypothetical protein
MFRRLACGFSLGLLVAGTTTGCTATIDADKSKLGPRPTSCVVGSQNACACPGGVVRTQVCNAYGRYDLCMCGGAGVGG